MAFIADPKGILWVNFPRFEESLNKDLSYGLKTKAHI